jgi:predicted nucleic acid-binding protein
VTHLLDTSALLAHAFREHGWQVVQSLLDADDATVGISALSVYEADRRLVEIGISAKDRREFAKRCVTFLDLIVPVDEKVAAAACILREKATARIADTLIAATAKVHAAILVHRDAHFAAIPAAHLRQLVLPEKSPA